MSGTQGQTAHSMASGLETDPVQIDVVASHKGRIYRLDEDLPWNGKRGQRTMKSGHQARMLTEGELVRLLELFYPNETDFSQGEVDSNFTFLRENPKAVSAKQAMHSLTQHAVNQPIVIVNGKSAYDRTWRIDPRSCESDNPTYLTLTTKGDDSSNPAIRLDLRKQSSARRARKNTSKIEKRLIAGGRPFSVKLAVQVAFETSTGCTKWSDLPTYPGLSRQDSKLPFRDPRASAGHGWWPSSPRFRAFFGSCYGKGTLLRVTKIDEEATGTTDKQNKPYTPEEAARRFSTDCRNPPLIGYKQADTGKICWLFSHQWRLEPSNTSENPTMMKFEGWADFAESQAPRLPNQTESVASSQAQHVTTSTVADQQPSSGMSYDLPNTLPTYTTTTNPGLPSSAAYAVPSQSTNQLLGPSNGFTYPSMSNDRMLTSNPTNSWGRNSTNIQYPTNDQMSRYQAPSSYTPAYTHPTRDEWMVLNMVAAQIDAERQVSSRQLGRRTQESLMPANGSSNAGLAKVGLKCDETARYPELDFSSVSATYGWSP